MTQKSKDDQSFGEMIRRTSLIAIILGLIATVAIVFETNAESYSTLYIKPGSYSNLLKGDNVSFTYGVQCSETGKTQYNLTVFLGNVKVANKEFTLDGRGKTMEEAIDFQVPRKTSLPVKVNLVLDANGREYSNHFWIRGRK